MQDRTKRQDWVAPTGEVLTAAARGEARGAFMGNRGAAKHLRSGRVAAHGSKSTNRWLVCTLEDTPGSAATEGTSKYAKLFSLDEATALAAGHRPCERCRPSAYETFTRAWRSGVGDFSRIGKVDEVLRAERSGERPRRPVADLPDGTFVEVGGQPYVIAGSRAVRWTPRGYSGERPREGLGEATLVTPKSTVAALRSGYPVQIGAA